MEALGTRIPNCHRKDAAQTRDGIETSTRVGLENKVSIRTGRKAFAAGLQLATQLLTIIDLAVGHRSASTRSNAAASQEQFTQKKYD
jgi:hypothetical protein